jgi:hypothetical protein
MTDIRRASELGSEGRPSEIGSGAERRRTGMRFAVGALVILGACEIMILQLYVGAMQRLRDLTIELEYARGSATIASAQAQRCGSPPRQK